MEVCKMISYGRPVKIETINVRGVDIESIQYKGLYYPLINAESVKTFSGYEYTHDFIDSDGGRRIDCFMWYPDELNPFFIEFLTDEVVRIWEVESIEELNPERDLIKERVEDAFNAITKQEIDCATMLYNDNGCEKITSSEYYSFMNNHIAFQKLLARWIELNDLCLMLGIDYDKSNYADLSEFIVNY